MGARRLRPRRHPTGRGGRGMSTGNGRVRVTQGCCITRKRCSVHTDCMPPCRCRCPRPCAAACAPGCALPTIWSMPQRPDNAPTPPPTHPPHRPGIHLQRGERRRVDLYHVARAQAVGARVARGAAAEVDERRARAGVDAEARLLLYLACQRREGVLSVKYKAARHAPQPLLRVALALGRGGRWGGERARVPCAAAPRVRLRACVLRRRACMRRDAGGMRPPDGRHAVAPRPVAGRPRTCTSSTSNAPVERRLRAINASTPSRGARHTPRAWRAASSTLYDAHMGPRAA